MTNIVQQERETYEAAWAMPEYAKSSPGVRWLPIFLSMPGVTNVRAQYPVMGLTTKATVLDAGCGAGKGAIALDAAGFKVEMCDITNAGLLPEATFPFKQVALWDDLGARQYDYVYCCDVMEHLPSTFTMLVAQRLLDVCRRGVFFSIGLEPDIWGAHIGKPLHQTLQSFVQWRDQLRTTGELVEARDLLMTGAYFVRPR